MTGIDRRMRFLPLVLIVPLALCGPTARAQSPRPVNIDVVTRDLVLEPPATPKSAPLTLDAAMRALNIPSVSIDLVEGGHVEHRLSRSPGNLYQAASLSKLVTAVAALRLVEQGRLDLDRDVNDDLTQWRVPASDLTRERKVTLRGLLSMTAGIGVPGYSGYAPGEALPSLVQILDGTPPANSPPVRVGEVPGTRFAYSGGGYEIVQALIEAKTGKPFAAAMDELVFRPAGMSNSTFAQPLPDTLAKRAQRGHRADGSELPGGWRVMPELAAGGLWSTTTELSRLLRELAKAWRGEPSKLLRQDTVRLMLTPQNDGPYGLGGAVAGSGDGLVLMKRGQNVGYQAYMLVFPARGQGIVVMTGSDNGSTLATALIRRAVVAYGWPQLGELKD
jgi:CubicO group peptidase (beta-lactamase class C family)